MRKIINLFIACYRNVKHSISTFLLKRQLVSFGNNNSSLIIQ